MVRGWDGQNEVCQGEMMRRILQMTFDIAWSILIWRVLYPSRFCGLLSKFHPLTEICHDMGWWKEFEDTFIVIFTTTKLINVQS